MGAAYRVAEFALSHLRRPWIHSEQQMGASVTAPASGQSVARLTVRQFAK